MFSVDGETVTVCWTRQYPVASCSIAEHQRQRRLGHQQLLTATGEHPAGVLRLHWSFTCSLNNIRQSKWLVDSNIRPTCCTCTEKSENKPFSELCPFLLGTCPSFAEAFLPIPTHLHLNRSRPTCVKDDAYVRWWNSSGHVFYTFVFRNNRFLVNHNLS